MSTLAPLCFVLMPFGKKPDAMGVMVDFDAVYGQVIRPAIVDAGLDPIRADEEMTGGIIHKAMFERLILCPFAVADLTTANANVFYELGIRHAVLPATTALLFAEGGRLPFDVNLLRALPYRLNAAGAPDNAAETAKALTAKLVAARDAALKGVTPDSPIFQLVENFPDLQRLKTDVFRERHDYANKTKEELARARKQGEAAIAAVEAGLPPLDSIESGVLIDLFLSYRGVKAWQRMVDLAARMPRPLAQTVMVQEQLALALNRVGQGDEAERILEALLTTRGPSSETYGILGRIYKDRWQQALKDGKAFLAKGVLDQAIDMYLKGFQADSRDAYPGINALTLMELREPPDPRQAEILPVVAYAVKRRADSGKPDYWDYATMLELAVLAKDEQQSLTWLGKALPAIREKFEPETTLNNLTLIQQAREKRGEATQPWFATVLEELKNASA